MAGVPSTEEVTSVHRANGVISVARVFEILWNDEQSRRREDGEALVGWCTRGWRFCAGERGGAQVVVLWGVNGRWAGEA